MRTFNNKIARAFFALTACMAMAFGFLACSNDSGGGVPFIAPPSSGGGTQNGGGAGTPTPTPTQTNETFTITFNANDGSKKPSTMTQKFTIGTPQALKTIAELGFKKDGYYFLGWGLSETSFYAAYVDGYSYVGNCDLTLYAIWVDIPVYSVNVVYNENGTVTADPVSAPVGTEITLSNKPNKGYRLKSYDVYGYNLYDSNRQTITVTSGKFTMPEYDVYVDPDFEAINYSINVNVDPNGSVTATPPSAVMGTQVTLCISPANGYGLETFAVTAADGTSVTLTETGNIRTFTMPAQDVNVNASFVAVPSSPYSVTSSATINGRTYDLVTFGTWPQTIKASNVEVDESKSVTVGAFTYYRGSDGALYAKIQEYACEDGYKYSDGTPIKQGMYLDGSPTGYVPSYKYFKVEPIKWRVLTTNYNGSGNKLLLAENVLTAMKIYDYHDKGYRLIDRYKIHPSLYEHSRMRAFLNGKSYIRGYYDENRRKAFQETCDDFLNKGFLQTAFSSGDLSNIVDSNVTNDFYSANPYGPTSGSVTDSTYIFDPDINKTTVDKIFLISMQEATMGEYGFGGYNQNDDARSINATDYAKASGVECIVPTSTSFDPKYHNAGSWWLRSLRTSGNTFNVGSLGNFGSVFVKDLTVGVVPALCVK